MRDEITTFDFAWFAVTILWIVFWIAASIIYRKRAGKPIIPRFPADTIFAEKKASGRLASNCLMVAVTNQRFFVTPQFPFNLMFLPEIYGNEHDIPVSEILDVTCSSKWLGHNLFVTYGLRGPKKLRLRVRDPEAAREAIHRAKLGSSG